ncbi:MAG: membrane protein insertase YidC [Phycisphaerales bacterium]|jgi:YidC/Oxa1 family membrane protein insertase|nr:membrane protein insertase YidC [Phycisphaerales bacterium]
MPDPPGSQDPRAAAAARLRRIVPLVVGLVIILVVVLIATAPRSGRGVDATPSAPDTTAATESSTESSTEATPESAAVAGDADAADAASAPSAAAAEPTAPVSREEADAASSSRDLTGLHVVLHETSATAPTPLGGLEDPSAAKMQVEFTWRGAGIERIVFADIWTTAQAKRRAAAWFAAKGTSREGDVPPPDAADRYVLTSAPEVSIGGAQATVGPLAAANLWIGDTRLNLWQTAAWKSSGPGQFSAEVQNEAGESITRLERTWSLDGWDLVLDQRIINVSGQDLEIRFSQYGPPNLEADRSRYMDRRRFRFGYLLGETIDPDRLAGVVADGSQLLELADVTDPDDPSVLWPREAAIEEGFQLSWFASTNRYFALTIHPMLDQEGRGDLSLEPVVGEITRFLPAGQDPSEPRILTVAWWPSEAGMATVPSGATKPLSMGVYAGPLEHSILADQQPYRALNMQGLILYQMSSFCAICTFQWLAHLLLAVLAFFDHWIVFDWGVAIILLVLCVRALLHPITRRSQMGMQKFGKQMQRLKPEMDKLRAKYGDDKKKMQEEQMRLFREHGVNPLQMLGCLPMFLQMPIWVALYAALYFSFDLRQQPAFWGVFQEIGGWPFLADLASPDHFFWEAQEPFKFLLWNVTGVNLLPILMGVIFFFQQKYMTPKTAMSPEQETQQKIMRVMMVVLFPVMLYSAPSGLTLYILTSSSIGIMESRHIRKQVDAMDLDAIAPKPKPARAPGKTAKDAQSRAYAKMMDRRKQKQNRGPEKRFKKRK